MPFNPSDINNQAMADSTGAYYDFVYETQLDTVQENSQSVGALSGWGAFFNAQLQTVLTAEQAQLDKDRKALNDAGTDGNAISKATGQLQLDQNTYSSYQVNDNSANEGNKNDISTIESSVVGMKMVEAINNMRESENNSVNRVYV